MSICGNMVGGLIVPKSFVLEDENGNSFVGVTVGEETVLTATDNDVRENMTYASDGGISTGTKVIPSYNTTEGYKIIPNGSNMKILIPSRDLYDYTKLQAVFCSYNSSLSNSVSVEKISILDKVYVVQSTEAISDVTKDPDTKAIEFGFLNETGAPVVIRYFTYKEIY